MSGYIPPDLVAQTWYGPLERPESIPACADVVIIGGGIGPGAGKATVRMLTGTDTGIDLSEFRLSRFFDGARIRLQ